MWCIKCDAIIIFTDDGEYGETLCKNCKEKEKNMHICQKCGTLLTNSLIFCSKCTGENFYFTETTSPHKHPIVELAEKIFVRYPNTYEKRAFDLAECFYKEAEKRGYLEGVKNENNNG